MVRIEKAKARGPKSQGYFGKNGVFIGINRYLGVRFLGRIVMRGLFDAVLFQGPLSLL